MQTAARPIAPSITPLAALLLLAACGGPGTSADQANGVDAALDKVPLEIRTGGGAVRRFTVEVAATQAAQRRGLMHRESLAPATGMVFPFAAPETASFWMKDTRLPLDLLFVRPDGSIARVLSGRPGDLHPLTAGEPVSAVVEIAGGSARRLGIGPGAHVRWGDCRGRADPPGAIADPARFCPAVIVDERTDQRAE